jgi:hypothetical protein
MVARVTPTKRPVEPGVRGKVDFLHIGQTKGIVVSGEHLHFMDIDVSADGDAETEYSQSYRNGFAEAGPAHQQQNQYREHKIEMLFHAERPNMREGLIVGIVDAEILREGKKLPGGR